MYEFATSFFNGQGGVTAQNVDVVSISFAWSEANQCKTPTGKANPTCTEHKITTPEYVDRTNTEFAKIGALGTTIVVSSGDDGAPGNMGQCDGKLLDPLFPAASPFATTVGGTMLMKESGEEAGAGFADAADDPICSDNKGCATSKTENACAYPASGITTGGGFSHYAPQPSWQKSVVDAYLQSGSGLPPSSLFNASNRAYPDVAAVANNYMVYAGTIAEANDDPYHFWIPTDGTSAAAPVVAGMLALVKSHTGKRLGMANPMLYQLAQSHPSAFKDITQGSNTCKSTCCGGAGYKAAKGWDPVTGLGTLNFPQLLSAVASVQAASEVIV